MWSELSYSLAGLEQIRHKRWREFEKSVSIIVYSIHVFVCIVKYNLYNLFINWIDPFVGLSITFTFSCISLQMSYRHLA